MDDKTRIAITMDYLGWEQDGAGPCFINVGGNGERREFGNWSEALAFCVDLIHKMK